MKKSFGEGSELDGYDDLKPEDQAKIVKAWQDGHIADEDIPDSARKPVGEDGEEKPKKARKAPAKKKAMESDGEADERPKKSATKVPFLLSSRFTLLLIIIHIYRRLRKTATVKPRRRRMKRKKSPRRRGLHPRRKLNPKKKRHPRSVHQRRKKRLVLSFIFLPFCGTNLFCLGV